MRARWKARFGSNVSCAEEPEADLPVEEVCDFERFWMTVWKKLEPKFLHTIHQGYMSL